MEMFNLLQYKQHIRNFIEGKVSYLPDETHIYFATTLYESERRMPFTFFLADHESIDDRITFDGYYLDYSDGKIADGRTYPYRQFFRFHDIRPEVMIDVIHAAEMPNGQVKKHVGQKHSFAVPCINQLNYERFLADDAEKKSRQIDEITEKLMYRRGQSRLVDLMGSAFQYDVICDCRSSTLNSFRISAYGIIDPDDNIDGIFFSIYNTDMYHKDHLKMTEEKLAALAHDHRILPFGGSYVNIIRGFVDDDKISSFGFTVMTIGEYSPFLGDIHAPLKEIIISRISSLVEKIYGDMFLVTAGSDL